MTDDANEASGFSIYGGFDPADLPRYNYREAARATDVPASTIGVWVSGMHHKRPNGSTGFYRPIIVRPDDDDTRLSFNNVLEVNALRALRQVHEVRLDAVRKAIDCARDEHGIDRLLTDDRLRASGGRIFLDYYFRLVELSNSQQLAMRAMLRTSLRRVEIDEGLRASLYPTPRNSDPSKRPIVVSPYLSFGSAVIERIGVSTHAIRSRFDLGEERADIAADYGLNEEEFDEAILYEAAA
jgi:uncharacterized protein (DUF433 family)